jgi:hypothetical protein
VLSRVSLALKEPLSKRSQMISCESIYPQIVLAESKKAKNQKALSIKSLAFASSLFLIYLAMLGKRAMDVAIAKMARGS